LYYLRNKTKKQIKVVCGAEEANKIFEEFHASSIGAHTGQKKTRDAISLRFYWPGMSQDIDTWVITCTELILLQYYKMLMISNNTLFW